MRLSETFVNSFGGYPIGCGLGIVILPISMWWIQEDPLVANLVITFVYATVSFARSYFLRRVFEKFGIDDLYLIREERILQVSNNIENLNSIIAKWFQITRIAFVNAVVMLGICDSKWNGCKLF